MRHMIWWRSTEPPYYWAPDGMTFPSRRAAVREAVRFRRQWPGEGDFIVLPQGERPDRLPAPDVWRDTGGEG